METGMRKLLLSLVLLVAALPAFAQPSAGRI